MPHPTIELLRQQLRRKFPQADHGHATVVAESAAAFAEPARAEFPKGAISEVVPRNNTRGLHLILSSLLEQEPTDPSFPELALIDGRDQFDPCSLPDTDRTRILWIRCNSLEQTLKAADILLHDGNLPRFLLDLSGYAPDELKHIPISLWYRFKRMIETSNCEFVVLALQSLVPCCRARFELASRFTLDHLDLPRSELIKPLHFTLCDQSNNKVVNN